VDRNPGRSIWSCWTSHAGMGGPPVSSGKQKALPAERVLGPGVRGRRNGGKMMSPGLQIRGKPFELPELLKNVREVLDRTGRPGPPTGRPGTRIVSPGRCASGRIRRAAASFGIGFGHVDGAALKSIPADTWPWHGAGCGVKPGPAGLPTLPFLPGRQFFQVRSLVRQASSSMGRDIVPFPPVWIHP
jgi:hypothetical protein